MGLPCSQVSGLRLSVGGFGEAEAVVVGDEDAGVVHEHRYSNRCWDRTRTRRAAKVARSGSIKQARFSLQPDGTEVGSSTFQGRAPASSQ